MWHISLQSKTYEKLRQQSEQFSFMLLCVTITMLCIDLSNRWLKGRGSHYSYWVLLYGLSQMAEILPPLMYTQWCGHKMCSCRYINRHSNKAQTHVADFLWYLWMFCLELLFLKSAFYIKSLFEYAKNTLLHQIMTIQKVHFILI